MHFQSFVSVCMRIVTLTMNMGMVVNMFVFMGMYHFTMLVLMGVDVAMLMGMLQSDGILDHKHRGCNHNRKSNIELYSGALPKKHHTK